MKKTSLTLLALASLGSTASAVVIGIETFDTDGLIADQTGGTGFNYNNLTSTVTGTTSDWDNTGGAPSVVGGVLVTNSTSAKREFNGLLEGSGDGDIDNSERTGGFRGVGTVFFRVDMTRTAGAVWSGVSSYDFGSEKIFFGVTGAAGADEIGIQDSTSAVNSSTGLFVADGTTNTIMGVVDFDNDLLGVWLNPDGSDSWDGAGGTADATLAYTGANWSTAARLGSGGEASWDNLVVGNNFSEVQAIPEPSTTALILLGGLAFLRRRR